MTQENQGITINRSASTDFPTVIGTSSLYIHWGFARMYPGKIIRLSYQLKARIGEGSSGQVLARHVGVYDTDKVREIFPQYCLDGPHD